MTKKNNLYINIKDDDSELEIIVDFLRDGEISSRSIAALKAFYLSLAIAKSPNSTSEEIRRAEHYCLSQLKQQMCYIIDKHYRDDEIKMNADEFSTVTINQSAPSNLGLLPLVQPSSIVGVASHSENGAVSASIAVPSQSSVIADLQEIPIVKKAKEEDEDDEDEDDDEDDESQMSDEEYLASKQHLLTLEKIK
ncbi:hypothetical protein [Chamaesiphon sp.]|uniref:hypothetical protein n=1 Tax=Chamaesiphon sp. TaxID=2814140 RepID=UPI0035941651